MTKKASSKKASPKKASSKKAAPAKSPVKKTSRGTPTSKKASSAKPTSKKPVTKSASTKKTATKSGSAKPAAAKPASKAKSAAPATSKKSAASDKPSPAAKTPEAAGSAAAASKTGRKGITIVNDRKTRKPRVKQPRKPFVTPGKSLLGPGVVRKPLIPSGPNAVVSQASKDIDPNAPKKTPFNKRELMKFKNLLILKRAELFGDIEQMEADALRSSSGDLSSLPQHLADQGSDSYDQSLSLNLAAADRRLIKEIDDALSRIDAKTYGVCERTGRNIRATRLQELPWARYSIEAAREMERHGGF